MAQRKSTQRLPKSDSYNQSHKTLLFILLALALIITGGLYFKIQSNPDHLNEPTQQTPIYNQPEAEIGFVPESTIETPQEVSSGSQITFSIVINPHIHKVSTVKPLIKYDNTVLRVVSVTINNQLFPLESEKVDTTQPGMITFGASINPPLENAVQESSTVAEITFRALKKTNDVPTEISFDSATRALSVSQSDGPQSNVIAKKDSAYLIVR